MSLQTQAEIGLLLILAAALSAAIGLDREERAPAGLRTHMLVGIGACLFTVLSIHAFPGGDPARVAAQIVSGIGFLGAGTIMQRKGDVHHLTTAASIWATAAVGMAVGAGIWFLAIFATLLMWVVLRLIRRMEPYKVRKPTDKPDL
ncbi:MAG: magnesium transporter MgtC [Anaerolineaceae bacterium]|nr:magnesium transporter MgtC [Anaerolineaceae bacterium]